MMIIVQEIKEILGNICQRPGAAFYSHVSTLVPGDYLILGLNPGGDPKDINSSIEKSFEDFKVDGYNAYYQKWNSSGSRHRLQRNIQELFLYLGYDLRKVCATNLYFERTINEKQINQSHIAKYREVLKKILDVVRPKYIIAFGIQSFNAVSTIIDKNGNPREERSGDGSWKIRLLSGFNDGQNLKLVGLPHLSIYTLYNRADRMQVIKDFFACT